MEKDFSSFLLKYVSPDKITTVNNLKETTKDEFLLNLASSSKEVNTRGKTEDTLVSLTDFILFSQSRYFYLSDRDNHYVKRLNKLVDYEKYIRMFFAEYLGLKVIYSPIGIRINYSNQPTVYFNIGYILDSICQALVVDRFKDYNNFTDYRGFCENLLLNILQNNLYQFKNESFFIVYLILLLKNPETKFFIRNNHSTGVIYSLYSPFASYYLITELIHKDGRLSKLYGESLLEIKEYLASVISRSNLESTERGQMKRNSTGLLNKLMKG